MSSTPKAIINDMASYVVMHTTSPLLNEGRLTSLYAVAPY